MFELILKCQACDRTLRLTNEHFSLHDLNRGTRRFARVAGWQWFGARLLCPVCRSAELRKINSARMARLRAKAGKEDAQ